MAENEELWRKVLVEGSPIAVGVRAMFGALPTDPRCTACLSPFKGLGSRLTRLIGRGQSRENPLFCEACIKTGYKFPGGAHIPLAMVFADVRGSTPLAERIGDREFSELINRFFQASSEALIDTSALLGRLAGDEAIGFYVPSLAGPEYAQAALRGAEALLSATGHSEPDGPWVPIGAGVHAGTGYVGMVGSPEGKMELTALGDEINVGARLAEAARPGEILASLQLCRLAGVEVDDMEHRVLNLKGKETPFEVAVMTST